MGRGIIQLAPVHGLKAGQLPCPRRIWEERLGAFTERADQREVHRSQSWRRCGLSAWKLLTFDTVYAVLDVLSASDRAPGTVLDLPRCISAGPSAERHACNLPVEHR